MLASWIKKSIGFSLALTVTLSNVAPSFAGGALGRAVVNRVAAHAHGHIQSKVYGNHAPKTNHYHSHHAPVVTTYHAPAPVVAVPACHPPVQVVNYPVPPMPAPQYAPAQTMPVSMPMPMPGPMGNPPVDLVIENIRLVAPSTMLVGPAYNIQVRNQGSEFAAKFHIALFASVGGVVNDQCPNAMLEVRDLAPGAAIEYTIRLPLTAEMMLDPMTQQPRPFTHIASVVDFFRMQPEADENNNTALLPREVVDNVGR